MLRSDTSQQLYSTLEFIDHDQTSQLPEHDVGATAPEHDGTASVPQVNKDAPLQGSSSEHVNRSLLVQIHKFSTITTCPK